MMHSICTLPDSTEVRVDLIHSGVASDIAKQPQLLGLVKEALRGKKLTGQEVHFERDLGRSVGYDSIIETAGDDGVFYAQIVRDTLYTRFIKGVKPLSTNYVSIVLKRSANGRDYELQEARVGRMSPPRPGADNQTAASKQFWEAHAFVQDGQALQLRTVTKVRPY